MLNFFLNAKFHELGNGQMEIIHCGLGVAGQGANNLGAFGAERAVGVKSQSKRINRAGSDVAENHPKRP